MNWTYTTLKSAIQDYVESADSTFVSNLPIFIQEAEQRILQNVQIPVFRKNVTGTSSTGNSYLTMPSDFLTPLSLALIDSDSNYNYLLLKDVSFIRDYTPATATTGNPLYYALFDENTFILAPAPNANYTFELHYVYNPQSITASSDGTSWLGTNAGDTLFYGSLAEAAIFLKLDPNETQMFEGRFASGLSSLKNRVEVLGSKDEYRYGDIY
jgi:hypothetical protein|tara:strand:- start:480 stop:1115 length:636 start_codon:yes stop_codon:yes gene_type:complete